MELIKHLIGNETVYISKLETVNSNSSYTLLGFKDSLAVLSTKMDPKPIIRKTVKIQVSNTGEKFIMVNGKRIKILAESEFPKNAKIVKITNKTPVKFNILQSIPKSESQNTNLTNFSTVSIDNNCNTSEISAKSSNKIKIPASITESIKPNTTDKCGVVGDNLKIENKGGRQVTANKMVLNRIFNGVKGQSNQCTALDLTKNCETLVKTTTEVMKVDKSVQTEIQEIQTCTKDVQTDLQDEEEESFFSKMDFSFLLDDSTSKRILDGNLDSLNNIDDIINNCPNEYTTLTQAKKINSLDYRNVEGSKKQENFFNQLRSAFQADDKGNMPIHVGVLTNDLKLVKRSCSIFKVLKQDVNISNNNDMTPLQLAVINEPSLEIINCLLQNGAQIDLCDSEGNTVLHYAVEHNRSEALKLLLNFACQQHLNVDQHNNEGLTPLMICCLNRSYDCAEILLDADADPNAKDQISGRTALFHAAELHDVDMVELLLQFNACTKIKNFFGTSPHDAMYEIDDMPDPIKFMILGKASKRKPTDDYNRPSKFSKKMEKNRKVLKTYARLEKIPYPDIKSYSKVGT